MTEKMAVSVEVAVDSAKVRPGADAVNAQLQAMAAKAAGASAVMAEGFRRVQGDAVQAARAIEKTLAARPDSAAAGLAQSVQAAALARSQAINASLSVIGQRSVVDIRAQIAEVNRAVASLRANGAAAEEIGRASQAAKLKVAALNAELIGTSPAAATAGASMASAAHRMAAMAAAALAAQQAVALLRSSVATGVEFDSLKTQFNFASGGDVEKAAQEMRFASGLANKLGLELVGTSKAYAKLQSAALGTSLAGDKARAVFQAVASAGAVMGLSAEEQSGALLAISQMMSKGTVSAEELRGQLGERLPGAFQVAAKAMGVTTEELGKLLEAGAISSEQFLPRFAEALQASVEGALPAAEKSARAQLQRLENAFTEFKLRIAESGLLDRVSEAIRTITERIGQMADSGELDRLATQFAEVFSGAAEFMANAAVTAGHFSAVLVPLAEAIVAVMAGSRLLALATPTAAAGISATGAAAGVAARGVSLLAGAMRLLAGGLVFAALFEGVKWLLEWGAAATEARSRTAALDGQIQTLIASNSQFAGQARRDAEGVREFGDDAYEAYQMAIKGARDYAAAKVVDLTRNNKGGKFDAEIAQYREQAAAYNDYIDTVLAGETLRRQHLKATGNLLELEAKREKILAGEVGKSKKDAIEEQIKDYGRLVEAIRKAIEENKREAEAARQQAAQLKEKAAGATASAAQAAAARRDKGLTPEEASNKAVGEFRDASRESSFAQAVAEAARLDGRTEVAKRATEKAAQEAERALKAANKIADDNEAANAIEDAGKLQAKALEAQAKLKEAEAAALEKRGEGLNEQLVQAEAKLAQLKGEAAAIPVNIEIAQAINKIAEVEGKLAALQDKTVTVTVNTVSAGGGVPPANPLSALAAPGFATGGPLPGSAPHDRADNMLYWGTPGEWVMQLPAVRYYGADFMRRLNAMQLPRYADGGALSRLRIPALPAPASRASTPTPVNLHLDGRRYPMSAAPDVVAEMTAALGREALKRGARR
ncbi:MAG TPA: tape measure protein [Rhodocyclaceae bacterium]|nr:tape measure protein [Rhodocyclaceae bacterium]